MGHPQQPSADSPPLDKPPPDSPPPDKPPPDKPPPDKPPPDKPPRRAGSPTRSRLESKREVLLRRLRGFYADAANLATLTAVLSPEAAKPGISLRVLDWLITNYAKKRNVVYELPGGESFNVYVMYKAQLDGYSKKFFDPFCRRERLAFQDARGREFSTTVGQLNFFKWAISNGVVAYGLAHAADIEGDMLEAIRHRDPRPCRDPKPRRRELSRAAVRSCARTPMRVLVTFA